MRISLFSVCKGVPCVMTTHTRTMNQMGKYEHRHRCFPLRSDLLTKWLNVAFKKTGWLGKFDVQWRHGFAMKLSIMNSSTQCGHEWWSTNRVLCSQKKQLNFGQVLIILNTWYICIYTGGSRQPQDAILLTVLIYVFFDPSRCRSSHIESILPKDPYLPCVSMTGRGLFGRIPSIYKWCKLKRLPRCLYQCEILVCKRQESFMHYCEAFGFGAFTRYRIWNPSRCQN